MTTAKTHAPRLNWPLMALGWLVQTAFLANVALLLERLPFWHNLGLSLYVASMTTVLNLLLCSPTDKIVFNTLNLTVKHVRLDGKTVMGVATDNDKQLTTLTLPVKAASGVHTLTLSYSDLLTERGFKYIFQTAAPASRQSELGLPELMKLAEAASGKRPKTVAMLDMPTSTSCLSYAFICSVPPIVLGSPPHMRTAASIIGPTMRTVLPVRRSGLATE